MQALSNPSEIKTFKFIEFLTTDTRASWLWLVIRIYVGYEWFMAGWEKLFSPLWTGSQAGVAVKGFLTAALVKTSGAHPDVQSWYAWFIQNVALPNSVLFSYLITFGEIAVGIALILGLFTAIAAFFGAFMNVNYLLAGTVSVNPVLFVLEIFLIVSWKVAGWFGLDRYALSIFKKNS